MVASIAVIGSLNVDFITTTPRVPAAGETFTATSFDTGFGGKGANQAVACARLSRDRQAPSHGSVKVSMVGAVGDDLFGHDYIKALEGEGIDTKHVQVIKGQKTGIANIIVEETDGNNRILVSTGANHASGDELCDLVPDEADVCVLQLEKPLALVLHNIKLAKSRGKYVIFNPAPAQKLPSDIYANIDCLVMNESEAEILGVTDLSNFAEPFLDAGVRHLVVLTLGEKGVSCVSAGDRGEIHVPARKAKVVDTTAAGDTFLGALAVQIAQFGTESRQNPRTMLEFANAAAARTVEKPGAMAAIPYRDEIAFE